MKIMATPKITIAADDDTIKPSDSSAGGGTDLGGVYHTRSLSRSRGPGLRRTTSRASRDRRSDHLEVEEEDDWLQDDGRKKQVFKGSALLWLSYQSVGAIYGDIGTSPLYVFSSTFTSSPSYDDLLQVLSVVVWSLTIMVTLKYILIILHADNQGEGGTFSCYSLLTRYANITDRDPREARLVKMERHLTQDMSATNRTLRSTIERSRFTRGLLKTIGVLAVSMVIADGVLTPAQSVLGAVQGLSVVSPNIDSPTIVGTSCGILVLLFIIQPLGTTRLATMFAPIVILWLGFNAGFGIYNLIKYDHSVLKAFSPYFAIHFFMEKKTDAWKMLGGILLAFTGVEALFADLGAFSMRAIQISWLSWCYPCLLLAYVGQAAYISVNPDAYSNPFYNAVPPGMLYPSLIVAVLAAIVASQAMITAVFQLISQLMKLSYCPQVKVVHTSTKFHGQLYVPFVNWILMCGTILVTGVYSNTTRLGNAYGVCVMFVTFFDTCMVTLASLIVWRLSPFIVFIPWLVFATVDCLYLSSALNKVPDGAWFTITISGILTCIFLLWRFGKENQWHAEAEDRFRPAQLIHRENDSSDSPLILTPRWGGGAVSRIKGLGIYFDKAGVLTPTVFTQFVSKFGTVPDAIIFFHLHPVEAPSVAAGDRYAISRIPAVPGCYRLVVRHGYMDEVITPDLAALIYEQVRKFIIRDGSSGDEARIDDVAEEGNGQVNGTTDEETQAKLAAATAARVNGNRTTLGLDDEATKEELGRLDRAYASKVMYIIGKEQMHIKDHQTSFFRRILLTTFLWIRENTRAKIANLRLSMDRVVEVGFVKEI
ncbi:potassium transporter [Annulohypoxylon maeteangense]|uniref:potassium transporter n=1 Tax=Annulohypoxylon maeteangense TaxID=1927788 RepID=UPI002007B260|nr:potassium transporter [Annulohypoxylon maeteangense]KAI0890133.1 potassium transporter [Annulohypoxylon maeteangense]